MIKYTSTIDSFDELMNLLSDIFYDNESCTLTDINDFLWFDSDYIFESLGIEVEE